jgi:hypothetical protein
MSTAPAAVKHSAAPPSAAPASAPPRQLRPLSPAQIGLAEHMVRHHVVTLPPGSDLQDIFDPAFWAHTADRLRVCDRIDVFDARGSFYAEVIVRAVSQTRPMQGIKGGARVFLLRHVDLDPIEPRARPVEHAVEYRGPADLWCVIRSTDGAVVKSHIESRELAERHIASMAMAI